MYKFLAEMLEVLPCATYYKRQVGPCTDSDMPTASCSPSIPRTMNIKLCSAFANAMYDTDMPCTCGYAYCV